MTDTVLTRIQGGVGYITLNRPKALHALNLPMCEVILTALREWRDDPDVHVVMIDHADGTRGFCAGGDIAMLRESGMSDGREARAFFAEEYRMNAAIKAFPKPYVAIMDGVTMGGGVGLSVHGSYRIATERTLFAMPETGIGLFPDVGGGWFLPRLRGELGTWLALTGARLKGSDVAAAGVATHFLPSELVPNLKAQILDADFSAGAAELLGVILKSLTHTIPAASYAEHHALIDSAFRGDRAEDMVAALEASDSDWGQKQAALLRTKSPETVKVALRQVREGARCETFEENMRMEYRIGWRKVQSPDFIEGVRAVIIDKDNAPAWSPARLEDVSDADVDRYFAPLGADELSFD
ncbi:enoyl-CoA hydratase/isomerase family protein [Hyphomonas sp. FCG-A18]|uniref:enoyl-CoA hydratase/isomerase family protein n=1 Tax=Hyphomonas sp. FCG-A18 TaxID=3080019 RepID=UPI002B2AC312|nr:enoyl-CoA hydratase/isomerase family protein [Hyphomonas sp. FCG-A18]